MDKEISVYIITLQGKKSIVSVSENSLVDQLFDEIVKKGIVPAKQADEIRLVDNSGSEIMARQRKFLRDYNIKDLTTLFIVLRTVGGH